MLIKKLRDFIYPKIKTSIYYIIKMNINSLKIKNKTISVINDNNLSYIDDFNVDSLKVIKKESRIGANIYYIRRALGPYDDIMSIYIFLLII